MDDLLKVFFWETSECIASCWLAVDRLRQVPDDADSFEDMLEQFRTMRETSRFLGMSALQAAAGTVLESLESARAHRPESMERMVSLAVDGLKRIEAVVKGMMIADAAMAEDAPMVRPSVAVSADLTKTKPASRSAGSARSRGAASDPRKADSQKPKHEQQVIPAVVPSAASQPAATPVAAAAQADTETLNQLISIVHKLAETQEEILRRLPPRDSQETLHVEAPATAAPTPAPADAPVLHDSAPALAAASDPAPREADPTAASRHLLFTAGDGSRRAVSLDRVEGVEELELDAVDNDRGLWITRWNGSPLPLIPVDPDYRLSGGARSSVIIFRIGGQKFGLLIGATPEISEIEMPSDSVGNLIPVIDPSAYFEQFIRGRFQRRRRKPAKSLHSADAARPAIPADDDLFVRKSVR